MRRHRLALLFPLLFPVVGCEGEDAQPEGTPAPARVETQSTEPRPPVREQVYDREFLFVSVGADSLVHVPWFFSSRAGPETVRREIQSWLARAGSWEPLAHEALESPDLRSAPRLLPGDRVRLTVGEADRIEGLRLRDPSRELETRIGEFLGEWSRPGPDLMRLFAGTTHFPSGAVTGFVLELGRRWEDPGDGTGGEGAPGDWIFLNAGSELQLFLEEETPLASPRSPASYRGWSRFAFQTQPWSGVTLVWEELRPFEPARRDIPAAWRFASPDGMLRGELLASSSHLYPGESEEPILPVTGFFEVLGEVTIRGETIPVVGLVRHLQR